MALIEVYVTKINEVIVSIGHCGFSACWGPAPSSNSPGTRNPTCREPYCCWKKWCNRYKSWIVSNILVVLAGFLVLAVGLLLRVIQWLKFPLQLGFLAGINQSFHPVKPIGSYWNPAVCFSSLEGGWIPCLPSLRWGVYFLDRHSTRCFLSGEWRYTWNKKHRKQMSRVNETENHDDINLGSWFPMEVFHAIYFTLI